jgi:hypothetical protein
MTNATINRGLAALKRILNVGAWQSSPKVDRVMFIPMLKENNTRRGFFEHGDFLALREAPPDFLRGFVIFAHKTGRRFSYITGLTWRTSTLMPGSGSGFPMTSGAPQSEIWCGLAYLSAWQ